MSADPTGAGRLQRQLLELLAMGPQNTRDLARQIDRDVHATRETLYLLRAKGLVQDEPAESTGSEGRQPLMWRRILRPDPVSTLAADLRRRWTLWVGPGRSEGPYSGPELLARVRGAR